VARFNQRKAAKKRRRRINQCSIVALASLAGDMGLRRPASQSQIDPSKLAAAERGDTWQGVVDTAKYSRSPRSK